MKFELAGKKYTAKELTFATMCELEDMGISVVDGDFKPLNFLSAYVAVCAECSREEASKLIEKHLIEGGSLDALNSVMLQSVEESGFFRALRPATEAETPSDTEA